ncbi:WXG100 family type VII secretion target, partial [Streptomyces sp. NPDC060030]|uniref:WXG100 family type VII secretion target n=1 Tax=Streptomyces sp. NPDC060030 TaxID=3347042 RepID=UPI0036CC2970
MGIRFTDDQRRLFLVLTGMEPPKLDPDRLRGVADGFSEVLGLLASLPDDLVRTVGRIRTQFTGIAADRFVDSMSDFLSGPDYVGSARGAAGSVAKYARSAATSFEYAV